VTDLPLNAAIALANELERETGCRLLRVERVRIARALREAEERDYAVGRHAGNAAIATARLRNLPQLASPNA
jgi:hypothetical protein